MSEITPFDPFTFQYIPNDPEVGDEGRIVPVSYIQTTDLQIGNSVSNLNVDPLSIVPIVESIDSSDINVIGNFGVDADAISDLSITVPSIVTAVEGGTTTLTANSNLDNTTFQWQKQESTSSIWNDIPGATSRTYTTPVLSFDNDNGDKYRVIARNQDANNSPVTSSIITLNVRRFITITVQPTVATSYGVGETSSFSVTAVISSGPAGGLQYQWQKREFGTSNFVSITVSGNTSSYTTPPLDTLLDNGDSYRCVVSHPEADSVISNSVTLTVTGADYEVTPAVNGISFWRLSVDGPLILDPANSSTYTIRSLEPQRTRIFTRMWGQGSCNSSGGYSEGSVPTVQSQTFTVRLNAGGGTGGNPGGGYAGMFNGTTVSQASALLIAGGAGGGGASTISGCTYSGGTGGGLTGGDAYSIPGPTGGVSATQTASAITSNPACPGGPNFGWYTRSGGANSNPTTGDIRQIVIKWDGAVVYDGPSSGITRGFIVAGNYRYYPSNYRDSSYGWCSDGTSCGTCATPSGDFGNAFDVYRSDTYDGGKGATQSSGGFGGVGFTENVTQTFDAVGTHTINIPPGATNITYEIVGGTGGRGGDSFTRVSGTGAQGARGQKITGTLTSQAAGKTLTLRVAGNGGNGGIRNGGSGGSGYNSGGAGGNNNSADSGGSPNWYGAAGGGGGGSSAILDGTNRIVVAGGGGGGAPVLFSSGTGVPQGKTSNVLNVNSGTSSNGSAGGNSAASFNGAGGGGGGGNPGGDGGAGSVSGNDISGEGGFGGAGYYSSTYVSSAAVSTGTTNAYIRISYVSAANNGSNGSALQGGAGGQGGYVGGGGGGGYFGGGGGAGFFDRSTGGGGGSGFVSATVSGFTSGFANSDYPLRENAGSINGPSRLIIEQTNIVITQQPTSVIAAEGTSATISVTASISQIPGQAIQYQWQKRESGTAIWNNIAGANNSSYVIPNLTSADNGDFYRCILSNSHSVTVTTTEIDIVVISPSLNVVYRTAGNANFTIPQGVERFRFYMWGAGGDGTGEGCSGPYSGGSGGYISGVIDVTFGDVFLARVGSFNNGSRDGLEGFGAGKGGGWTGLFKYIPGGTALVAMAGGGGGAGQAGNGGGGGTAGINGTNGTGPNAGSRATVSSAGSGGSNGGGTGEFYTVGNNFNSGGASGGSGINQGNRGGGGGGGYYGGGGGGGTESGNCSGGGGGGGSGFINTSYLGPSDTSYSSSAGLTGTSGGVNPAVTGAPWNTFVSSPGGYQAGRSGNNGLIIFELVYAFDFQVSPAVAGKTNWSLTTDGPLILDGGTATTYTLTALRSLPRTVKMWGEGTAATGGYSTGVVNFVSGNTYTVRLNAGSGAGGTGFGWPGNGQRGGGYAGLFNGTVINQANAIMIAGGSGGTGGYGCDNGSAHGGGSSGTGGCSSNDSEIGSTGGGGGSQSSGGSGGNGGGQGGTALQGGTGGNGQLSGFPNAGGGGGGGGGYFGGGGGGGGNDFGNGTRRSSGGGGGSGYINTAVVASGITRAFANAIESGFNDPVRGNAGGSGSSSRVVIST